MLRVRGKQWYWIYKYDLSNYYNPERSFRYVGRNKKVPISKNELYRDTIVNTLNRGKGNAADALRTSLGALSADESTVKRALFFRKYKMYCARLSAHSSLAYSSTGKYQLYQNINYGVVVAGALYLENITPFKLPPRLPRYCPNKRPLVALIDAVEFHRAGAGTLTASMLASGKQSMDAVELYRA